MFQVTKLFYPPLSKKQKNTQNKPGNLLGGYWPITGNLRKGNATGIKSH